MESIGHGEVADPRHLNADDGGVLIAEIAALAVRQGRPIESVLTEVLGEEDADDPIARGLVKGQLLGTLTGNFDNLFPSPDGPEPEPDLYPRIESVTVNPQIERLVRELYPATMAALVDGKMWNPGSPREGDIRPPTLEETIALLQKLGIMTDEPIDKETLTPCRSDFDNRMIGEDGLVSGCAWNAGSPYFREVYPEVLYSDAVLRPVVMAKRA